MFFTLVIFVRLYIVLLINFLLYLFRGPLFYQFSYYQILPSPIKSTKKCNGKQNNTLSEIIGELGR